MRYAIFSDIHANMEALEAVLAKIDEISQQEPIDKIWFLGDLVGYGPNPNECITKLRERTNVIIAGNHDWAAVGKIDLEDFSPAARISAEWTAKQLTEEHRNFLTNLPERLEFDECTLVHGSPYGPLWEYLTSELLAERSFQYFNTRYCFVGHTHVPIIFQQLDTIANTPTTPLVNGAEQNGNSHHAGEGEGSEESAGHDAETGERVAVLPAAVSSQTAEHAASAYAEPATGQLLNEQEANILLETQVDAKAAEAKHKAEGTAETGETEQAEQEDAIILSATGAAIEISSTQSEQVEQVAQADEVPQDEVELVEADADDEVTASEDAEEIGAESGEEAQPVDIPIDMDMFDDEVAEPAEADAEDIAPGTVVIGTDEELAELLNLFNLSQSMVQVTNEMSEPPEGAWQTKKGYRAIINPGGVGQPRDGDPRAAFMIYDTERGFEFYRVPYAIQHTQEKIIQVGLPTYLAMRLAYGR